MKQFGVVLYLGDCCHLFWHVCCVDGIWCHVYHCTANAYYALHILRKYIQSREWTYPANNPAEVSPIWCYFAQGGIFALKVPYSPRYNFHAFCTNSNFLSGNERKLLGWYHVMWCDKKRDFCWGACLLMTYLVMFLKFAAYAHICVVIKHAPQQNLRYWSLSPR